MQIIIRRTYTLPNSREGRGKVRAETLVYDADDWRTPVEWAAETLKDAGCTRCNRGDQYVTEERKITDFSRGEEMTATATLEGFTTVQLQGVYGALGE